MTEYLIVIEGEQFLVEAPHVLAAWEVALAQSIIMRAHGELPGEDANIEVMTVQRARKEGISVLFPTRLERAKVLEEAERLHGVWRKRGQTKLEQFTGVRA